MEELNYEHLKVVERKENSDQEHWRTQVISEVGNLPKEIVFASEEGRAKKSQMREMNIKVAFALLRFFVKIKKYSKVIVKGCETILEKYSETNPKDYTLIRSRWVSIEEDYPKPKQRVTVVCEKPKFGGGVICFQTMAEYIPYMTVKEEDYIADEFQGDGDYNEEEDEYYTQEGFYEWQSEPEINWKISSKVTHWQYIGPIHID